MSRWTRLTVQGTARRADVVLPDDEPVAALIPSLLTLLEEGHGRSARPVALVTLLGDQLDTAQTLAEQAVPHGAVLRVVRIDEAPPPPEVVDVTELAADVRDARGDRWRPGWTAAAGAVAAGALGAVGATAAARAGAGTGGVLAVAAGLALLGALLLRRGRLAGAAALGGAAAGAAVTTAAALARSAGGAGLLGGVGDAALVAGGLAGLVLAVVAGLGARDRSLALGGAALAVLVAAALGLGAAGWAPTRAAAVLAVVGTVLVGLLPGVALTVGGLSGLDDRVVAGRRTTRAAAHRAVDATFRALTATTVATALVTGAAAWVLVRGGGADDPADVWSRWTAVAVAAVLLLRTRLLPLAPQRLALLAAGTATAAALGLDLADRDARGAAVAAVVAVLAVTAAVALPLGAATRARLRRAGDVVEGLALVALVPLVLAHAGVFADLLGAFR